MDKSLHTYNALKQLKQSLTEFMMMYKFALDEIETRMSILQEEFELLHEYSPIEHIKTRLKSPESIFDKVMRKKLNANLASIKTHIQDIAGLRITCSFISDIYKLEEMLRQQTDMKVLEVKDYIKTPKENGYRSLHLIVEVPVYTSQKRENVCVEIQIRTIAMDFWASLEHKIFYKYEKSIPVHLTNELAIAAQTAAELDAKMETYRLKFKKKNNSLPKPISKWQQLQMNNQSFAIPQKLLEQLQDLSDS
ncbi:LOW QUALITY PROTEIN: GTP pyrophosphokinase [Bacillus sp. JCM 19045]|nr:LOW QUALITY PROTEIN: GTP pyrophosphokinase [Bacillus sp. JCM 19045]